MGIKVEDKLKPCPFCGNKPKLYPNIEHKKQIGYIISCSMCMVKMLIYTKYKYQALAHWNRRNEC